MGIDPASTPLGKMLLEEISPVVMILRTPHVEESCEKNGLSLVEMLKPFSDFSNIDVPVRTSSDLPYRLRQFRLRLFYESEIQQPNPLVLKKRLKDIVTHSGEEFSEPSSDIPRIDDILSGSKSEVLPSWFERFNKEIIHGVSFSEHEAFDHPVACLLVVSSKDEDPINKFVDLFNTNKLPALLNDGAMDPKILKYFLLVHDNQDGSSEKTSKILMDMKHTFGSSDCKVLCINSSSDGLENHHNISWTSNSSDESSVKKLGHYLTSDDLNEIRNMMQELSSKHIIPHIEQKVRMLNQQVSSTRKGFRNQIKNLWWRKGKEDAVDSSNGQMYTFSSIESQIRVLGDYAFILQDYELAMSNYRLISTDYKLDKAWKRYAGVQEMLGLTLYMMDQSHKEADYCMDNAFTTYIKIGPSGHSNATRCGLWWIEMLKSRGQSRDAASVHLRICNEETLLSAVMLEQASYCYLLAESSMQNKYGFHLVLSGDHYIKCDQIKHAIRAYRSALSIYNGTKWSYIKDHIHFHIGKWYGLLGMYDVAAEHLLEIVACSHLSRTAQDIFLKDFSHIVQNAGKKFEVSRLQLPVINVSSVKVIFEDHRTYSSPAAATVKDSFWLSLEEELIPSLPSARANWLDLQSKVLPKRYKESKLCVAGEQIRISVEFKNPLQIPISVSCVSLFCEHVAAGSNDVESDSKTSTYEASMDGISPQIDPVSNSYFTLTETEISLIGEETKLVELTVTPLVEGTLKIIGVRWKLSGSVYGFFGFDSVVVKKKTGKRKGESKHPLSNELQFVVIKSVPKIEGTIDEFPASTYHGASHHLNLKLTNSSQSPVKNLKLKVSHPRFFIVGDHSRENLEIPSSSERKNGDEQSVFTFPTGISVHKESPLAWPLWLRAACPGAISLAIVLYYEMEEPSSPIKYRTLRMLFRFQVQPSMEFSMNLSPWPSKLDEFLLRMDVVNRTSSSFLPRRLSSVGDCCELSLLQPLHVVFPSQSLLAGQALSCFFKLRRRNKSEVDEGSEPSGCSLRRSVVELSLDGDEHPVSGVNAALLSRIHESEREHGKAPSPAVFSLDFVLISQLQTSSGEPGTASFFSHHACYCSAAGKAPISWVIDGPRRKYHNFEVPFCEIELAMRVYNSSDSVVFVNVRAEEVASADDSGHSAGGWQPSSNDVRVSSDHLAGKTRSIQPLIWSGCSSSKVEIEPFTSASVPLQICVFSAGVYDVSNYVVDWRVGSSGDAGLCLGYPFYVTVLHSDS